MAAGTEYGWLNCLGAHKGLFDQRRTSDFFAVFFYSLQNYSYLCFSLFTVIRCVGSDVRLAL